MATAKSRRYINELIPGVNEKIAARSSSPRERNCRKALKCSRLLLPPHNDP
jgi:hypothetical protein